MLIDISKISRIQTSKKHIEVKFVTGQQYVLSFKTKKAGHMTGLFENASAKDYLPFGIDFSIFPTISGGTGSGTLLFIGGKD